MPYRYIPSSNITSQVYPLPFIPEQNSIAIINSSASKKRFKSEFYVVAYSASFLANCLVEVVYSIWNDVSFY